MRRMGLLVVAWVALMVTGCSSATIKLNSGLEVEGYIAHSDPERVFVALDREPTRTDEVLSQTEQHTEDGRPLYSIRREYIKEIDHPGLGHAIAGTVLTVVGLSFVVWGIAESVDQCSGDLCGIHHVWTTFPGGVVAATGLPLMIWGWAVYAGSDGRAEVGRGGSEEGLPSVGSNTMPLSVVEF